MHNLNQEFEITKGTSYLSLICELWGVYCDFFWEIYHVITASHCICTYTCVFRAVWYKTKVGSQNFGHQIWGLSCNICNVFKNMFNMSLINNVIKYYGSVIPHDWDMSFGNLEGYQLWQLFEKINFQGRDKLIFQSISPNKFAEVLHTIGCKIPLGTVC